MPWGRTLFSHLLGEIIGGAVATNFHPAFLSSTETTQMILAERIDFSALTLKLLGEPNTNLSNPPRDMRFGSRGSMAVNYESGKWFDHENQVGGGVLDLRAIKTGRTIGEAQAWLRRCHRGPAVRTIGKLIPLLTSGCDDEVVETLTGRHVAEVAP